MTFHIPTTAWDDLAGQGWTAIPAALSTHQVTTLREECLALFEDQHFHRAGIGSAKHRQVTDGVRQDWVCWWEPGQLTATQQTFHDALDYLREALNQTFYLGLKDIETHYAVYQAGAFYKRHVDQFQNKPGRKISMVFYLNQDWRLEDGGQLRIHSAKGAIDIEPTAGKLLLFRSDQIEHEVRPANKQRLSITGWFRN